MPLDDDLRSLAALQYSVLSRAQARRLGASTPAVRHRVEGPDWELATWRVLRLVGSPPSVRQRLMIAVLDAGPGAAVSHRSAAALWRLPGFSFTAVEVSRQRGRSGRATEGAVLHRPRRLLPSHITARYGIPVTTVARTLFDLAAEVHPARMERLVETVLSKSPSTLSVLRRVLDDLGGSGRGGVAVMRAILAERPEGYVAPASGLEARFERILAEAGEAPLERQVDVGGHDWVGRVDYVDRELRILVEIDSDVHHTSLLDRAHDAHRDEQLRAAGWREIVRITEDEVWRRPQEGLARLRDARHRARDRGQAVLAPGIDAMVSISGART